MKQLLLLLTFTITASSFAQIVNIPDPEFKQRLLNYSNPVIDTNGDGEIQVSEAEAFDDVFFLGNSPTYTDITGIGAFINMTGIFGSQAQFPIADFSNNNSLEEIQIQGVLEEIILPVNTANLEQLQVFGTQVSDLSMISNYPNLTYLEISNTNITEIDVSNNLLLESLSISSTDISELDIINNINLTGLRIRSTLLTSIDLSNVNLVALEIGSSTLNTVDLSLQTNLESLIIGQIAEPNIGLSNNINLHNLTLAGFNHPSIDISSNTQLEDLVISSGLIDTIDLSTNPLIESIRLDSSLITEIDLSQQTNLLYYYSYNTNIPVLDLTSNVNLEWLDIWFADIQTLDLSQNVNLTRMNLLRTLLENIDVTQNIQLVDMDLRSSPISDIIFPANNILESFVIWNTLVEELDFSTASDLCSFFVRYNSQLNSVNIKNGNNINIANGQNCNVAITYNPNLQFVCVDDANFAAANFTSVSPYITFTEDCSLNSSDINQLTRDVTYDLNNNGCSSGDFGIENTLVSSSDGTNTFATSTSNTGAYSINVAENTYTTSVLGLPSYFETTPTSAVDTFVGFNVTEQQDFCVQATTTANDLNISINPQFAPQPGEQGVYNVVYQNAGTTQLNATVTLTYDPDKVSFAAATPAISSQTTNTLTWNLGPINPFTTASIIVRLDLFSQPINMEGDDLILQAVIDPISGDATPDDNVFDLLDFVRNPEIIDNFTVVQGAQVLVTDADEFLNYVVPFTNTTQNVVNNVTIFTIFDADVDVSTLQIIDSSHPVSFSMANNEAFFELDNIGLPVGGSVLGQNRGYVMYRIKPRAGIVDGDVVSANVNLKLDGVFQQTNFVSTIYRDVLDTPINEISTIKLYPNPTNGLITIETNSSIKEVKVFNLAGQLLKTESNIQNAQTTLNIEAFPTGIYFANVKTERGEKVFKIVKK
ncbi:MAG: hypothetical protein ACJA1Z_001535 [Patiriisocius sp.]|jgi:hypothetical protein